MVFFTLEYHKTHLPGLDCRKKKYEKLANVRPKPWTNPFGKISIFRGFKLLVLMAQNDDFRSRIS